MWAAILLSTFCASPTADEIMQRVIENQTRAQEARKNWVYTQEIFARSTQRNKTLMREETRTFRVLPNEKGNKRESLSVAGQRRVKGKLVTYDKAIPDDEDDSIDEWVSDLAKGKDDDEKGNSLRDAFSPGAFPLAGDKLKGYIFTRKPDTEFRGHAVYAVEYKPLKNGKYDYVGGPWEGEVLVEKESFQPVFISSFLEFKMPAAVKILLGTNIRDLGFKMEYDKFGDVWFPVKGSGEFKVDAVWFFKRNGSYSMKCYDFRKGTADSSITFTTP
ncbi:MAG: hypothetical protein K2X03_14635 [Bryobacteraceae bacterium]|nr:hypothetical protein [Bryobacteraceae bacterium]